MGGPQGAACERLLPTRTSRCAKRLLHLVPLRTGATAVIRALTYITVRGQFFEKCQMEEQAEDYYLRSLEADPNNAASLQEYGNFLHEKGLVNEAEKFFIRASVNTLQDARATARDPKAKGLRID